MRDANVFAIRKAMPRMSWGGRNLYNLWRRTVGEKAQDISFTRTNRSLFQQRWVSKAVVRGYHGDYINEKIFKRWYLPSTLPDVRPRRKILGDDTVTLNAFAKRQEQAAKELKLKKEEDEKGLAPVGSLMFAEVERRIDVIIFRACLAHSVYEARRLVIHGDVLLNGKKHQNANTRLAPGDMVSVNPKAIRFLQPKPVASTSKDAAKDTTEDTTDASATSETTSETAEVSSKSDASDSSTSTTDPTTVTTSNKQPHKPKPKRDEGNKTPLTPFNLPPFAAPFLFIPAYLEPSFTTCSVIYVRHPTARPGYSEVPTPYDADGEVVRLAWEWYAKNRPRLRSKTQLARMPENRQ